MILDIAPLKQLWLLSEDGYGVQEVDKQFGKLATDVSIVKILEWLMQKWASFLIQDCHQNQQFGLTFLVMHLVQFIIVPPEIQRLNQPRPM